MHMVIGHLDVGDPIAGAAVREHVANEMTEITSPRGVP
jgi:hypothetical protein